MIEVRSWTKCSTRRFVIAFHHFGTPILLFESLFSGFNSSKCQFVSAFYEVDSSFPEFDSSADPGLDKNLNSSLPFGQASLKTCLPEPISHLPASKK